MPRKSRKSVPVWAKSRGAGSARASDAELCIAYCAGRDVSPRPMADSVFVPHDLWTNRAHAAMLCRRGIISAAELASIERALARIERRWARGAFELDPALEDVHINIERAVAAIGGERAAGVMHTARSRNDQTATDMRLWLREALLDKLGGAADLVESLARLASRHRRTVMAGWTHGQPAMPTTLGHWAASHGHALARDLCALRELWPLINRSPLGAAAGFGSSWPIDRGLVSRLLGFDAPQSNSLDCVSTRWECEARLGSALSILMTHLSSLGQDLIFLSSAPRRLITLDPAFTTGSSIMPQKRNPDFAEVTRARAASVNALVSSITASGRAALSGYNRDSQWTKYWMLDLSDEVGRGPELFARVVDTIEPDRAALARSAGEDFVSAVDLADRLASSRGVEFRRLYHLIAEAVQDDLVEGRFRLGTLNRLLEREGIHPPLTAAELDETLDPRRAIEARRSAGGPSPDDVAAQSRDLRSRVTETRKWSRARRRSLERARRRLNELIVSLTNS